MIISDTLPQHWKYVSEGGATIVFTYVGPPHPQFSGMVLRLRKSINSIDAGEDQDKENEPDDPSIEFQKKCIERLLPSEHLPRLESVHVNRGWLKTLAALHDAERPHKRRQKDHVDLGRTKGVLATDLIGGGWLAVEIKPKWGFLPSPLHLADSTRPVKTQTCRFCMHSHLRARRGEVVSSGYCPLDLFSNDEDRISDAIRALWDAWNDSNGGVNNLKIFKHGRLIQPSDISSIRECLDAPDLDKGGLRDVFTSAILPYLTGTRVLHILSKLQRTLDVLDIEGLSSLWREAKMVTNLSAGQPSTAGRTLAPDSFLESPIVPLGVDADFGPSGIPTISDWMELLDIYLSPIDSRLNHSKPAPKDLHYFLLAYLLSATFKDCSIIIRVDAFSLKGRPTKPVDPKRVTVIDLDPKRMYRLQKWEELDKEIVESYAGVDKPKHCIDGWFE